ncbi:MAG TPA: carbohydrate ABC transporter permease, partial [Porticoccus sp.]|nr:carbohydrate ABC transporter permease [Porticoccus sp.]
MKFRKVYQAVLKYTLIYVVVGIMIFPIYYLIVTAFKSPGTLFTPDIIPVHPSLHFFREAISSSPFLQWTMNSLIVAIATCGISLVIALAAAYSLARFQYRGRDLISRLILFVYMFPPILLVIPYFILMSKIGLRDTLSGLVVSYTTFSLPFSVWFLTAYMRSIPRELDEAALVDGCTRISALFRVILPVIVPGVAATLVYVFLVSWNEFLFAYILIRTQDLRTLPLGVAAFFTSIFIPWGNVIATTVLM